MGKVVTYVGGWQRNHTQGLSIEVISLQTVVDLVLWQTFILCRKFGINSDHNEPPESYYKL